MTTPVNPIPFSIDYTSRDYYAIRNDLIERMKNRIPEWAGNDPADFGVALVEAFAYMGDLLNYYIDRVANESYLGTATQRQSIINIAKTYGYYPAGYRAASVQVEFYNSSDETITIPAGTQVTADVFFNDTVVQVLFTTDLDTVVLPGELSEVSASHAEDISKRVENQYEDFNGEALGVSTGEPDQQFTLQENQVVDGSIVIWIKNGNVYEKWEAVAHLSDYGPKDSVYFITIDSNNFVCINFGDGISGVIPPKDGVIKAVYNVGGGAQGNLASRTPLDIYQLFNLDSVTEQNIRTYITATTNTAGLGGSDPESNDSIRMNAPKLFTSFNRAVTLSDYGNLALGVTGVGKANAESEIWNSVTTYVALQQDVSTTDSYPGYFGTPNVEANLTASWLALQSDVEAFMADKLQIGTTLTVSPPTYVPVSLAVQYTKKTSYSAAIVEANLRTAIFNEFSYGNMQFQEVITPESIEGALRFVEGVKSLKVLYLNRAADADARTVLVGAPSELFSFEDSLVSLIEMSSDASLFSLETSSGTLAPVFTPTFYNYNVTVVGATVDITALSATGGTIYINGALVTPGDPLTVTVPVGTTTFVIVVTAADSVSVQVYRLTMTRA